MEPTEPHDFQDFSQAELEDAEATALRLKNQIIFGWLYLRYHIGEALGLADPLRLSRYVSKPLLKRLSQDLERRQGRFWPVEVRPRIQLVDVEQRASDAFVFVIREADDSELSQILAPGPGHLEVVVEVLDASAWRLVEARRVPFLDAEELLWSSAIPSQGGVFLAPDGRQVVVAQDGHLEAQDTRDEVPPRYRVEPESGRGRWYRTSDIERAKRWAAHFSLEEGQRYLIYDRESLEPSGDLVAVYAYGGRQGRSHSS